MIMCGLYILKNLYNHTPCKLYKNVTCILLAQGKPSYASLPATNHPKAVGGVCHATINSHTVKKFSCHTDYTV